MDDRELLTWLLEPDTEQPGVRFFALQDFAGYPFDHPKVVAAQEHVMHTGPVAQILDAQYPAGYWVKPGPGYSPKYRATLWQINFLPQLGADGRDERIQRAVEHAFEHSQTDAGAFSSNGRPDGVIVCLWANTVRALFDLGFETDERLQRSLDGLARAVTGEGASRFPRITGPGFLCAANDDLPCAWGAIHVLRALNRVPASLRTPVVEQAASTAIKFLVSVDIAKAAYPPEGRVSDRWFRFGYPIAYRADVLLNLEALVAAGITDHPRIHEAARLVRSKRKPQGYWRMEAGYNDRMWADVEEEGQPSKWVTLRALRALWALD